MDRHRAPRPCGPPLSVRVVETVSELVPPILVPALERAALYASWELAPPFRREGRTAWMSLPRFTWAQLNMRAMKLKGVGLANRDDSGQLVATRPSTDAFVRPYAHVGFEQDGVVKLEYSELAPVGGMLLRRARQEFNAGRSLTNYGARCICPVQLISYDPKDLAFRVGDRSEAMGVVVSLVPAAIGTRADAVLRYVPGAQSPETRHVRRLLKYTNRAPNNSVADSLLRLLQILANSFGRALRSLAEAGYYRYSASLDNWGILDDAPDVYLLDLDSSRPLADCSTIRAPLEIARDVASGIFHLGWSLLRDPRWPPGALTSIEPFTPFVRGFFHDAPPSLVAARTRTLLADFFPKYDVVWRGLVTNDPVTTHDLMDRPTTHCRVIRAVGPLYKTSALGERFPWPDAVEPWGVDINTRSSKTTRTHARSRYSG